MVWKTCWSKSRSALLICPDPVNFSKRAGYVNEIGMGCCLKNSFYLIALILYCLRWNNLKKNIEKQRPELADKKGVVFHQDNARLHVLFTNTFNIFTWLGIRFSLIPVFVNFSRKNFDSTKACKMCLKWLTVLRKLLIPNLVILSVLEKKVFISYPKFRNYWLAIQYIQWRH